MEILDGAISSFSSRPSASQDQLTHYAVAALCIVGIVALVRRFRNRQGLRLPPGPPAWPVIGHLHLLREAPHRKLTDLVRKYGPLMYLKLGSIPTVVIGSPEMAREVLKIQDHLFASRPQTLSGEIFSYDYQGLLFAPLGHNFRVMRKICQMELFTTKRIGQFQDVRREEILGAVQRLLNDGKGGKCPVLNLERVLTEMNFNNITRVLFSRMYYGLKTTKTEEEAKELNDVVEDWNDLAALFSIGEFIPILRRVDPVAYKMQKRFLELRVQFAKLVDPIIEEHRKKSEMQQKSGDNDAFQDFVTVLLSLQSANDENSLSDEQIKGLLQDLVIGGNGTGSAVVLWTMAELMRHPEIRRRVQTELDEVVGRDRLVQESDLPHLKFLEAVMKETFRLHTPGPLTPRETIRATKINGYDIPARTRVIMVNPAVHRDPDRWENPLAFDPERFLDSHVDVKGTNFELIPFGGGRRICPGLNLGLLMVNLTLAHLLHMCEFSLPCGTTPSDVDVGEKVGVVVSKLKPLELLVAPRLAARVYVESGIDL